MAQIFKRVIRMLIVDFPTNFWSIVSEQDRVLVPGADLFLIDRFRATHKSGNFERNSSSPHFLKAILLFQPSNLICKGCTVHSSPCFVALSGSRKLADKTNGLSTKREWTVFSQCHCYNIKRGTLCHRIYRFQTFFHGMQRKNKLFVPENVC